MRGQPPLRETEAVLLDLLAREIDERPVDPGRPLLEQGLDSLMFVRYMASILRTFGLGMSTEEVLEAGSIRGIAKLVRAESRPAAAAPEQSAVVGPVPLLPNRRSYFLRRQRDLERWITGAGFFRYDGPAEPALWSAAAQYLIAHHDGLRLQVIRTAPRLEEVLAPPQGGSPVRSLSWDGRGELISFLAAAVRQEQQEMSFPGELFRVLLIRLEDSAETLVYVLCHHLLVDGVSFRMVVRDLFTVVGAMAANRRPALPPKTTSLPAYANALREHWNARREEVDRYLASLPWSAVEPTWLDPGDDATEGNRERDGEEVQRVLGTWHREGGSLPAAGLHAWVPILLAAIGTAYRRVTGGAVLCLGLVCHGRESFAESVDLSRTAGYLVDIVPILIDARLDDASMLRSMRQQLRWAWLRGRGYSVTRFVTPAGEPVPHLRHPRVSLNILSDSLGSWRLPEGFHRPPELAVAAPPVPESDRVMRISGGAFRAGSNLVLAWDYSRRLYRRRDIAGFADACGEEFARLSRSRGEDGDRPTGAADRAVERSPPERAR